MNYMAFYNEQPIRRKNVGRILAEISFRFYISSLTTLSDLCEQIKCNF